MTKQGPITASVRTDNMRKTFHCIFIIFFLIGCRRTGENNYKCADNLSDEEINSFKTITNKDYSDEDLGKLADITTQIMKCYGDSAEFEVFFNSKSDNFLALDIFGLENEKKIDRTVCALKNNLDLHLPASTVLLFHKYTKDLNDGGIVAGLKLKK